MTRTYNNPFQLLFFVQVGTRAIRINDHFIFITNTFTTSYGGRKQIRWTTRFFLYIYIYIQATLFSTQPQCCLIFSWIELEILLRCCLIYVLIIILRHILYLVYLCPYLGLGLLMSCVCDLFFIFSPIFAVINHIISFKQAYLFFMHFLEYLL